jgi:glycosyltransferase involved in cell wall biosynthesis
MFASIEYLLCGLPVVTTRSIGGRDVFFDPAYVEWVEDDPEAVAQGVRNLIARAPEPEFIRARTLARMEEHRQRLRTFLKEVIPPFEAPWPPGSHGALDARDLRELGCELRQA